jgi:hypothetical protein
MADQLSFNAVEQEFLRVLARHGILFIVIGGHAVFFHGHERPIGDLDVVFDRSQKNVRRLLTALSELGITGAALTLENLTQPLKRVLVPRLGIDLLSSVSVPFEELFRDRQTLRISGVDVPLCSRTHLLRLKQSSPREDDLHDRASLDESGNCD